MLIVSIAWGGGAHSKVLPSDHRRAWSGSSYLLYLLAYVYLLPYVYLPPYHAHQASMEWIIKPKATQWPARVDTCTYWSMVHLVA